MNVYNVIYSGACCGFKIMVPITEKLTTSLKKKAFVQFVSNSGVTAVQVTTDAHTHEHTIM